MAVEKKEADFVRTGAGTPAGRYLRRFWHPIYVARELPAGRAVPVRIMSESFTLYRGESGQAHLLAHRCAHRGEQISVGWVEGDCLRCFYHGWRYDASGQCVEQPAEDPPFAHKVRIRSWPTEEYLGLIFAYLGEGAPPALPRYPELEEEGVQETGSYIRFCNYFNSLENGLDEVHLLFTHARSNFTDFGLNWDIPKIEADETGYGIIEYGRRSDGEVRVTHFLMPNILYIKVAPEDSESGWKDAFAWRVPVDDVSHRSFNVRLVRVTGEAARKYREELERRRMGPAPVPEANEVARSILAGELRIQDVEERPDLVNIQDHVAQEGQGAIADRESERLGCSDAAIILLRKIWMRELQALAEGSPLKQWTHAQRLDATSGVRPNRE